ncbi:MAG: helix-turn-helix transcriptional regulator [Actinobacteria bacterium]|nr:helix-turn-helix transcriptional regulator [Actinomycetota bacterium]
MTATPQQLGLAIREQRRVRHLTLAQLGAQAHLSSRHLGEIERGDVDPRWSSVGRIVDALGTSVGEVDARGRDLPDAT